MLFFFGSSIKFTCDSQEDCLEDLSTLLERIFYQTVECLADTQWELRRMGQQVSLQSML